ncbi:hypothetical protein F5Y16DRAFT_402410 [Xylariaceae sp. FL0255]|nr:hypothetical protein F5Y16DRAFT_402410 [Xylariaceae sp. FL0255]
MDEDLFALLNAVAQKEELLSEEQQRLLDQKVRQHTQHGWRLPPGPECDRYTAIKIRLRILKPSLVKTQVIPTAISELQLRNSPVCLLVSYQASRREYAENLEIRRQAHIAHENHGIKNSPVFEEVILLQNEPAQLLGNLDYAASVLKTGGKYP